MRCVWAALPCHLVTCIRTNVRYTSLTDVADVFYDVFDSIYLWGTLPISPLPKLVIGFCGALVRGVR